MTTGFESSGCDEVVDAYISSCYVHLRKPDVDIFRLALDVAHTPAEQVGYVENTSMFVEVATGLGIRGVLHTDYRVYPRENWVPWDCGAGRKRR